MSNNIINYGALHRSLYLKLPTNSDHEEGFEFIWDLEISNCTGLTIGTDPAATIRLRTSREMRCAAEWLRTVWDNPLPLLAWGISPEFADESIGDYNATDLLLACNKTGRKKPRLYLGTSIARTGKSAAVLHSREATVALADAIVEIARRFDDPDGDLFEAEWKVFFHPKSDVTKN